MCVVFSGRQEARLGKITLVAGENSVGKSTLLCCYNALSHLSNLVDLYDDNHFARDGFPLDGFDRIARWGAETFSVSGAFQGHPFTSMSFAFAPGPDRNPLEQEVVMEFRDGSQSKRQLRLVRLNRARDKEIWQLRGPGFIFEFPRSLVSWRQFSTWLWQAVYQDNLPYGGDPNAIQETAYADQTTTRRFR